MSDFLLSFLINELIKNNMTRALASVIIVLLYEFIINDNKKSQMLNSIYHINHKKVTLLLQSS